MKPFANPFARHCAPVLCLAFGLTGWALADGEEKAVGKAAASAEASTEVAAGKDGPKPEIKNLDILPIGKTNLGVRMPVFEGSKQTMLFKADELTPMDADQLDMTGVEITILKKDDPAAGAGTGGQEEGVDTRIVMISSSYLVSAGLLSSDEKTVVYGYNYTLTGASLDFDTEKKAGVMRGPVKMIIRDFDKLSGDKAEGEVVDTREEGVEPEAENAPATESNNETIPKD